MSEVNLYLADEEAMSAFGERIARTTGGHGLIFLEGDLGAGKTTLSRGIIRGLGHVGAVKSPTFTLVEPYEIGEVRAWGRLHGGEAYCRRRPMRRLHKSGTPMR